MNRSAHAFVLLGIVTPPAITGEETLNATNQVCTGYV
jgi:hypothetical protein